MKIVLIFLLISVIVFYIYYGNNIKYDEEIIKDINDDEILVHFIYDKDFNGKIIEEDKLITKNLFLPNKGGVSHQRHKYCSENKCKDYAIIDVKDKQYVGFVIFKKKCFEVIKNSYILNERSDFEAEIVSTPLDEKRNYLHQNIKVYVGSKGNPSHADLRYINPAIKQDETPNIAIRSFSRKLSKICSIVLDERKEETEYYGKQFHQFDINICKY
jgi:hypothetical protein